MVVSVSYMHLLRKPGFIAWFTQTRWFVYLPTRIARMEPQQMKVFIKSLMIWNNKPMRNALILLQTDRPCDQNDIDR